MVKCFAGNQQFYSWLDFCWPPDFRGVLSHEFWGSVVNLPTTLFKNPPLFNFEVAEQKHTLQQEFTVLGWLNLFKKKIPCFLTVHIWLMVPKSFSTINKSFIQNSELRKNRRRVVNLFGCWNWKKITKKRSPKLWVFFRWFWKSKKFEILHLSEMFGNLATNLDLWNGWNLPFVWWLSKDAFFGTFTPKIGEDALILTTAYIFNRIVQPPA